MEKSITLCKHLWLCQSSLEHVGTSGHKMWKFGKLSRITDRQTFPISVWFMPHYGPFFVSESAKNKENSLTSNKQTKTLLQVAMYSNVSSFMYATCVFFI